VIHETRFDDSFCILEMGDWPVVRQFVFIQSWFLQQWRDDRFLDTGMKLTDVKTMLVILWTSMDEHSFRSQLGIGIVVINKSV